jgi:hypothetical protein
MTERLPTHRVTGISKGTGRHIARTGRTTPTLRARRFVHAHAGQRQSREWPDTYRDARNEPNRDAAMQPARARARAALTARDRDTPVDVATNGRQRADAALKELADRYGVFYSSHTSAQRLFRRILMALRVDGREVELCSWFAYRVYCTLARRSAGTTALHGPFAPAIRQVGVKLASRQTIVESIRRCSDDADFIRFSARTASDRRSPIAESGLNAAYRNAAALLRPVIRAEQRVKPPATATGHARHDAERHAHSETSRSGGRRSKLTTIVLTLAAGMFVGALVAFIVLHGRAGWMYWLYNRDSTAFIIR